MVYIFLPILTQFSGSWQIFVESAQHQILQKSIQWEPRANKRG